MAEALTDGGAALRDTLARHCPAGLPVVVAVSGGSDSLALLELALASGSGHELIVAHYDHGLRPQSDADGEFVRRHAAAHGIQFEGARSPAAGSVRNEDNLRHERYDFLAGVAVASGASAILTGHTSDDLAETVLAQLIRGTGALGVRGVAERGNWTDGAGREVTLLRPLLTCRRSELAEALQARGVPWLEDPTNSDGSNLRGRLRHEVMPLLAEVGGRDPVPALARFARQASLWVDALDGALGALGAHRHADVALLASLPDALLDHWLRRLGVPDHSHITWAREAVRSGRHTQADLPRGARLVIANDVRLLRQEQPPPPPLPGLQTERLASMPPAPAAGTCYLNAGSVTLPLSVRTRRDGDRFHPLGMQGTQLVSDFLTNLKVPAAARQSVPVVVTADDAIVWVAPYRPDRRFAATPASRDVLAVSLRADPRTHP